MNMAVTWTHSECKSAKKENPNSIVRTDVLWGIALDGTYNPSVADALDILVRKINTMQREIDELRERTIKPPF